MRRWKIKSEKRKFQFRSEKSEIFFRRKRFQFNTQQKNIFKFYILELFRKSGDKFQNIFHFKNFFEKYFGERNLLQIGTFPWRKRRNEKSSKM